MAKQKSVRLELLEFTSDRLQYKPYSAKLGSPTDVKVYVDVDIDESYIKESDFPRLNGGRNIVLKVEGLAAVMGKVADAIEDMHDNVKKRYKK
jgi:hypothetical protein